MGLAGTRCQPYLLVVIKSWLDYMGRTNAARGTEVWESWSDQQLWNLWTSQQLSLTAVRIAHAVW
jgi:hypothetical protein